MIVFAVNFIVTISETDMNYGGYMNELWRLYEFFDLCFQNFIQPCIKIFCYKQVVP